MGKTTKKVFVSLPMSGRKYEDIKKDMQKVILKLNDFKLKNTKYTLINSLLDFKKIKFSKQCKNKSVECLSRSIKYLSKADVVCFVSVFGVGKWNNCRGCRIEHKIAIDYNINIVYMHI